MEKIKVIQWFTGDIARHQIRVLSACTSMELVGAFVFHEEKHGRDIGEIAGIEPQGIYASSKMEEVLALEADCVLYNPPHERYDEIIAILASGKNVISIMAGWNPKKLPCYPDIVKACEQGNSSLYGTGLNPGLSYELALLGSSICTQVDSVYIKTCEPQASLSPIFLEVFGFGQTEENLLNGNHPAYSIFENLLQITDLLCEKLNIAHDGSRLVCEFEGATQAYRDKIVVEPGTMAGLLVKAETVRDNVAVATIELRFLLGEEYVRAEFLEGRPKQGWIEVDVRGNPGSRLTHEVVFEHDSLGTWSTGTKAINAIPFVCAAAPGLLSPLDLPLPRMLDLSAG
ncbi:hypothetical protein EDC56_2170 [Sinobacterium caligoides]|uniref:2,4-diaminopentanoate dehydrogenase C-terminal domain-containing protein n=1 Tax=Sinobacterium caligoides TaxID=933926 RepID=A0A3N2DR00_9GAMM|nr:hypothetical protein [Sinobacterium caligoides]ROS01725.1 hypothetical protein EDC56_2170 [Sinobacterium caligoides]